MLCRLFIVLVTPLLIATGWTTPVRAAISLRLDASNNTVVSGGTVSLGLILVDTDGQVDGDGGLFAGGGRVLVADASTAGASIADGSSIVPNSGFSLATTKYPFDTTFPNPAPSGFTQLAGILGNSEFSSPVTTVGGEITLAEFVISISGPVGATVELLPANFGGTFAANIGFAGFNFDAEVVNTSGVGITVVPEPNAGWLMCFLAASAFARRRLRQRLDGLPLQDSAQP